MVEPGDWPRSWVGWWTAADGKAVLITRRHRRLTVTVAPSLGNAPYRSAELLGGGTKPIERLPAVCLVDDESRRYLEIEAGTAEVGPTYRLYAALDDEDGRRSAPTESPVETVVLIPNTSVGLYDDWEDELGVPWAYPLEPLRWAGRR